MRSVPPGRTVRVVDGNDRVPIVVWFDDDCGVCSASVRWLSSHTDRTVRFRPSRELTDPTLIAGAEQALLVVGPRGVEWGVPAVAAVLDRTGRLGRVASFLLWTPGLRRLAGLVYAWVAANRSALSRRLGLPAGCALPPPPGIS